MVLKYDLTNAEKVIELARDIQSKVYWGGHFDLVDAETPDRGYPQEYNWKDVWECIVHEIDEHRANVVIIDEESNEVRFEYLGEVK